MITRRILASQLLSSILLFILTIRVSSFTYERTYSGRRHILVRRSHPSNPYDEPLLEPHFRDHPPQPSFDSSHNSPTGRHNTHDSHYPSVKVDGHQDSLSKALGENGLTRVLYEDEQLPPEDDYYYDEELFLPPPSHNHDKQKNEAKLFPEKEENESFPKKFPKEEKKIDHKKHNLHPLPLPHPHPDPQPHPHPHLHAHQHPVPEPTQMTESHESNVREPTIPATEPSIPIYIPRFMKKESPHALPVTTEGKTNTKKADDPLKVYGFPKELLPIMPGGGSRFEDVEREKLEKKKMSQTKGLDDDSAENGSAHEAEGLYSSASLSSISLCFYWLICFYHLDRLLML